jgi:predicted anti-sigma-YlaC factor YlaD
LKTCWNRPREVTDYYYVDCEEYREALSARLDDEEGPDDARHPADLHLDHCADCALWYDNAALITRRTRTTAAVAWPDVADAVLARVPDGASPTADRLRVALGAVGAAHGVTGLFSLTGNGDYQTAAWQLALAVAFGAVAARRTQPAGLVPLLGTFVGVLTWGFMIDNAGGALSILLSATGLVLVVLLGRVPPLRRGPVPPAGASVRVRRPRANDDPADGMRPAIRGIVPTKAA